MSEFINLLINEEDCLLIIDNVDDSDIVHNVTQLIDSIPMSSRTDILMTGKLPSSYINSKDFTSIDVPELKFAKAKQLFKDFLENEKHKSDFESDPDINDFLEIDLAGIPLLIKIVAEYFKKHTLNDTKLLSIKKYRKARNTDSHLKTFIGKQELSGYKKSVLSAHLPSIKYIQEKYFADYPNLVCDTLRFFTYFGNMQFIPISLKHFLPFIQKRYKKKINENTLICLLNYLSDFKLIKYKSKSDNFSDSVDSPNSIHELTNDNFIEIYVHPTTRLAVDLDFKNELDNKYKNPLSDAYQNDYWSWFNNANEYVESTFKKNDLNDEHVKILINFLECLESSENLKDLRDIDDLQCPESILIKFITNSKIMNTIISDLVEQPEKGHKLINVLPSEKLDRLLDKFAKKLNSLQSEDREEGEKLILAISSIANLYSNSKPGKIKKFLEKLLNAKELNRLIAIPLLAMLYFSAVSKSKEININEILKDLDCKNKEELFEKTIYYSNELIKITKEIPSLSAQNAYFFIGYTRLLMDDQLEALENLNKALEVNPFSHEIHKNLYIAYSSMTNQKELESRKHYRLSKGLKIIESEIEDLPITYKKLIYSYLEAESDFELRETGKNHSMDHDHGVIFGKVINHNPSITSLKLNGCHLNDDGVEAIAKSLETNDNIKELRLEWNSLITKKGVEAIAKSLQKNTSLQVISLVDCYCLCVDDLSPLLLSARDGMTIEISIPDSPFPSYSFSRHKINQLIKSKNIIVIFHTLSWTSEWKSILTNFWK